MQTQAIFSSLWASPVLCQNYRTNTKLTAYLAGLFAEEKRQYLTTGLCCTAGFCMGPHVLSLIPTEVLEVCAQREMIPYDAYRSPSESRHDHPSFRLRPAPTQR
ncbi:hypothetical protein GJAV_G00099850 [Gymnothorax javanicus]|nr:hypothetical protein GJAV_G00099850 [Gymnothorax javanicus]